MNNEEDVARLSELESTVPHVVLRAPRRGAPSRPVLETLARHPGLRSLTVDLSPAGTDSEVEPLALEPLADAPALHSLELLGAPWVLDDASLWMAFPCLGHLAWSGMRPALALKGRNWARCRIRTMDVEMWRFNAAVATCLAAIPTLVHLGMRLRGPYRRSTLERLVSSGSLRTVVVDRLPGDRPGTGPRGVLSLGRTTTDVVPRLLYEPRRHESTALRR